MPKVRRPATALTVVMAMLLAAVLPAGCLWPPEGTTSGGNPTGTSTAGTTSTAATTTAASSETTTQSTSGATTSQTVTEPSGETTPPAADVPYFVLPAHQQVLFDLNSDGAKEVLRYGCDDDYSFTLALNQNTRRYEGEMFFPDWFFLVDLDSQDDYLDIAIQEQGPSDDYQVLFFYYDGHQLIKRGAVPGMICDLFSDTIETDPFGSGTVLPDGRGNLTAFARGEVLHTWFYDEPWKIGSDRLLQKIPQDFIPMLSFDPDTGEQLPETAVTLKMDLPLLESPGAAAVKPSRPRWRSAAPRTWRCSTGPRRVRSIWSSN